MLFQILIMSSESEFLNAHELIKLSHGEIMCKIDAAIEHEEHNRPLEAITAYEDCLHAINEVFQIPVGLPEEIDNVRSEWAEACEIIQKLKSAKTELTYRLKVLSTQHQTLNTEATEANEDKTDAMDKSEEPQAKKKPSVLLENPTTHYDINVGGTPKTYREIINSLREVMSDVNSGVLLDTLFESQVKLYKIQANGEVSTLSVRFI